MKTEYWTTTVWLRGKGFLDYYCSFSCNFSNPMLLPVLQEKQLLLFAAPANWCRYPRLWRPGDTPWLHLIWHLLLSFSALMKSISKLSERAEGQGFSSCLNLYSCLRAHSCSTPAKPRPALSQLSLWLLQGKIWQDNGGSEALALWHCCPAQHVKDLYWQLLLFQLNYQTQQN